MGEQAVIRDGQGTAPAQPAVLADLLVHAAASRPDAIGVISADGALSWAELESQSASVASRLIDEGLLPGDHVVLMLPKSAISFVAMHAILRAGGVAVPIDAMSGAGAARALVAAVRAKAVLVDSNSVRKLDPFGDDGSAEVDITIAVEFGDDRAISFATASGHPRGELPRLRPSDPAYIIFTSGSTGAPKGIVHTHRSGLAYARLAVAEHGITADDRLAGMPPLHFDMSTLELYAAPLAGAAVVPISDAELRFPATFTERSEAEHVTVWYSVPFQLRQIQERGALDRRDLSSLRHVIYAGEPYPADALRRLMADLPGVRITNAYGPAETNVCTIYALNEPPAPDSDIPLGHPWGDVDVRIVDEDGAESRSGELWVSAPTVMAGYHDRPELTASRLVSRVESEDPWYRTGDLVRRDSSGRLRFLGRSDHQVKIRGVRLELESVEVAVSSGPGVVDSVVAPTIDSEGLVAAVLLAADATIDERALRRWCSTRLPAVAVPSTFSVWSEFPLTSSGKIDRSAVRSALRAAHGGGSPKGGDEV